MATISVFYKRLRELCEESNMTVNELVRILNLSTGSPTAWKSGATPRQSTVQKIADYFHVSSDYLVGNVSEPFFYLDNERILSEINSYPETEKAPTDSGERKDVLDEVDIAFYGEYKELTEEDRATIRDMVSVMRKRRASEK